MIEFKKALEISDCVLLIDNSVMFEKPILYAALSHGNPCYFATSDKPEWIDKILKTANDKEFIFDEEKRAKCEFLQEQIDNNFLSAV